MKLSLEALRREFDEQFSQPRAERTATEDFLLIHAGGQPWAIAVASLAGLARGVEVGPLPSEAPALLGLAVVDRAFCAVFDLGLLLGAQPLASTSRAWIVRVAAAADVALAFEGLDGRLRAPVERHEHGAESREELVAGRVLGEENHSWVDVDAVVARLQFEATQFEATQFEATRPSEGEDR